MNDTSPRVRDEQHHWVPQTEPYNAFCPSSSSWWVQNSQRNTKDCHDALLFSICTRGCRKRRRKRDRRTNHPSSHEAVGVQTKSVKNVSAVWGVWGNVEMWWDDVPELVHLPTIASGRVAQTIDPPATFDACGGLSFQREVGACQQHLSPNRIVSHSPQLHYPQQWQLARLLLENFRSPWQSVVLFKIDLLFTTKDTTALRINLEGWKSPACYLLFFLLWVLKHLFFKSSTNDIKLSVGVYKLVGALVACYNIIK